MTIKELKQVLSEIEKEHGENAHVCIVIGNEKLMNKAIKGDMYLNIAVSYNEKLNGVEILTMRLKKGFDGEAESQYIDWIIAILETAKDKRGISYTSMAEQIGIDRTTIDKIKTGKTMKLNRLTKRSIEAWARRIGIIDDNGNIIE